MTVEIETILFDLDGTLADTAPDLAYALNTVLKEQGKAPCPFDQIRYTASNGTGALIKLGFGETENHQTLSQRLIEIYANNITRETTLFDGMHPLLDHIEQQGKTWGVVTNKPAFLTDPLMEQLGLTDRAACIVSGDTTAMRKPHPEPLFHASRLAGKSPEKCLYVGDAERDIEAGNRAGMTTLAALFGYINDHDSPQNWQADGLIRHPQDILQWI